MTTREDFLAAIQADWKNDLLRNVYADWLEERGEEAAAAQQRNWRAAYDSLIEFCRDHSYDRELAAGDHKEYGHIAPDELIQDVWAGRHYTQYGNQSLQDLWWHNYDGRPWQDMGVLMGREVTPEERQEVSFGCSC